MDLKTYVDLERGRQSLLASQIDAQPQLVWQWVSGTRPVPADRRPDIERATSGTVSCEELGDDTRWARIPDKSWPWHPKGRPVIDVTRAAAA